MYRLGLDLGSTAVKAVLLDSENHVRFRDAMPCLGSPQHSLRTLLERLCQINTKITASVAVSGHARKLLSTLSPSFCEVSDVVAIAVGAYNCAPYTRDILSLGGQHSLWCRLQQERPGHFCEFALSDQCAAGAGGFLEQQASRLGVSLDELSRAALSAKRAPTVAGRCAVFTKSDLIHLQQKGTPLDEIALGLCHALVRTFQSQVLHGRSIELPVLLIGGSALNQGMVRAVREVFNLKHTDLIVPEHPEMVSALGTAHCATGNALDVTALLEMIPNDDTRQKSWSTVAPLPVPIELAEEAEPRGNDLGEAPVILGVDVGSVSTNLALVDLRGRLRDSAYVRTSGKPLQAIQDALDTIAKRHPKSLNIVGAGATGSGRHLAGQLLGVDLIKNEIAAQLRASVAFLPDVDTILEIGGQDAKYIHVENGVLVDFAMNRLCAAGTGSFLEEQAQCLGLSIVDEFAEHAIAAKSPLDFGCRCTVFMESEALSAKATGACTNDIAAGLALSVAKNYLNRVVGNRKVGERIVFQGGTASNQAVVAALSRLLGRTLHVHPHRRVSGALGVALLVLDLRSQPMSLESSQFRGFSCTNGTLERSFECSQCSTHCQVTRFRAKDRDVYFGDVCERYASRDGKTEQREDPLSRRTEILLSTSGIEDATERVPSNAIGLPRASHTVALLPWLVALVKAAGKTPYLSGPTTPRTLTVGAKHLTVSSCLPIKVAYGHVVELAEKGVSQVLIPSLGSFRGDEGLAHSCLFGHHLPSMLLGLIPGIQLIAPEISLDLPQGRRVDELAEAGSILGLSKTEIERALVAGDATAHRFRTALEDWGRQVLEGGHDRIAVVLARPYLLSDSTINMAVGRHLARLGLPVLPGDALPLNSIVLDKQWKDLPWHHARDLIRAALLVQRDTRLFPVVLSSFGCGPDAFTLKHIEHLFSGRPHLILELDEHRSEAGLVTRIEAFNDEIKAYLSRNKKTEPVHLTLAPKLKKRNRLIMPHFADHAYGQAGVLRAAGYDVILLPPPTANTRERGESLVSGRECHPFAMIAGDLVTSIESGALGADAAFVMPGTVVSCLLRQYGDGLDLMLTKQGAGRIRLVSLSLDSLPKLIGLPLAIRYAAVFAAADMLLRVRCRIRPYEQRPGQTDEVYRRSLERLAIAAEHGKLWDSLEQIASEFATIERRESSRPIVGVAGDIYTRVNDFASDDLFRSLENSGCEVWPAPFGNEIAEYNATRRVQLAWRLRRPGWGIRFSVLSRVFTRHRRQLEQIFSIIPGIRSELSIEATQDLVRPYLGSAANPLLVLNVGRMLMYANAGADGILNAYCTNCMVGSVSEALHARLKKDMRKVPMANLVYGDGAGKVNQTRLEAFVHQVKQGFLEKQTNQASYS